MADAGAEEKLKVFISYSRRDSAAFVDDLVVGLEDHGFAPILDRHDIKPGEPWEARLGGLIEQSDTVVFVISPEAVRSERCDWEVDRTPRAARGDTQGARGDSAATEAYRVAIRGLGSGSGC
jgi:TIR domain